MALKAFQQIFSDYSEYFSEEKTKVFLEDVSFLLIVLPEEDVTGIVFLLQDSFQEMIQTYLDAQQLRQSKLQDLQEQLNCLPEYDEKMQEKLKKDLQSCLAKQLALKKELEITNNKVLSTFSQKALNNSMTKIFKAFQDLFVQRSKEIDPFLETFWVRYDPSFNQKFLEEAFELFTNDYIDDLFYDHTLPVFSQLEKEIPVFAAIDVETKEDLKKIFNMYFFYSIANGKSQKKLPKQYDAYGIFQEKFVQVIPSSAKARAKADLQEKLEPFVLAQAEQSTELLRKDIEKLEQDLEALYNQEFSLRDKIAKQEKILKLSQEISYLTQEYHLSDVKESLVQEAQILITQLYRLADKQLKPKAVLVNSRLRENIDNTTDLLAVENPEAREDDVQFFKSWAELIPEKIYVHDNTKDRRFYVSFSDAVLKDITSLPKTEQNKYLRSLQRGFGSKYKESCIKMLDKDGDKEYQCSIKVLGDKWRIKAIEREYQGWKHFYFCWLGSDKQGC